MTLYHDVSKVPSSFFVKLLSFREQHKQKRAEHAKIIQEVVSYAEKSADQHAKNVRKGSSLEFKNAIKSYLLSMYLAGWDVDEYFPYDLFKLVFDDLTKIINQSQSDASIGPLHVHVLFTYYDLVHETVKAALASNLVTEMVRPQESIDLTTELQNSPFLSSEISAKSASSLAAISANLSNLFGINLNSKAIKEASHILQKKEIFEKYLKLIPLDVVIEICKRGISNSNGSQQDGARQHYIEIMTIFSNFRSDVFNQVYCNEHSWAQDWLELFDNNAFKIMGQLYKHHEKEIEIDGLLSFSVNILESKNPNREVMLKMFQRLKSSGFFVDASLEKFKLKNQIAFREVDSLEKSIGITYQLLNKTQGDAAQHKRLSAKIAQDSFLYLTLFYSFISKLKQIHSFAEAEQGDMDLIRLSSLEEMSDSLSVIESKLGQQRSEAEDTIWSIFNASETTEKNTSWYLTCNVKGVENIAALDGGWILQVQALNEKVLKMKPFFETHIKNFDFDRQVLSSVLSDIIKKARSLYPIEEKREIQRHYWSLFFKRFSAILAQDAESGSRIQMKEKSFKILLSAIRIAENHPDYDAFREYIRDIFIHASSHIPFEDLCRYIERNQSSFDDVTAIISSRLSKNYYSPDDVYGFFTKAFGLWDNQVVETKSIEALVKSLNVMLDVFRHIPKQQLMTYIEMLSCLAESKTEISDVLVSELFSIASQLLKATPALIEDELCKIGQILIPRIEKNTADSACFNFIHVFAEQLMQYSGNQSSQLDKMLETLIAVSLSDKNLVKLFVMLIDKFNLGHIEMPEKIRMEWQAFSKLKTGLNALRSRLEEKTDIDSFAHILQKIESLLSPYSEDHLLFSEKCQKMEDLSPRLDRLERVLIEARTLHMRTKPTTDHLMRCIKSEADEGTIFAEEVDAILDDFERKQEENQYENFEYLSSQIRLRHVNTLKKILSFVEQKLSNGEPRYESSKILCLKHLGFYREGLDYVNEILEKKRFYKQSFKHQFLLENKAHFLEKVGKYRDAVECRNKINDNFDANAQRKTHNLSRIFDLYLKIGDERALRDLLVLVEGSLQTGLVSEELAQQYKTCALLGLNCHHEVEQILMMRPESDQVLIQKMTLLSAQNKYQEALKIAMDILQRGEMNDNQTFTFFIEFIARFPATEKSKLKQKLSEFFNELAQKSLKNYVVCSIFMLTYVEQNKEFLPILQQYADQYGEDEYYLRAYATYLCHIKLPNEAVLLLEKHVNFVEKNHRLLLELAVCYTKNKQYEESKKLFDDLLMRFPDYPALYTRALFAFNKMKHSEQISELFKQSQKCCNSHVINQKMHLLIQQDYPDVVYPDEILEEENLIDRKAMASLECFPKAPHLISNFFYHRMCDQRASKRKSGAFNLSPYYSLPYAIEALDLAIDSIYRQLGAQNPNGLFLKEEDPDNVSSYDDVANATYQAFDAKRSGL